MKRVLTALFLTAFALYCIFLAPPQVFAVVVAMMGALCYHEFAGIARASGVQGPLWIGFIGGLLAISSPDTLPLTVVALLTVSLTLPDLSKSLGFSAAVVLGIIYTFLAWRFAFYLREVSHWWLLFALAINWVGDVAAFYVGRALGKRKLAPRISPGKSWEGAVASMFAAVVFGVSFARWADLPGIGMPEMALLSAAANVAGQVGDLAESALKRGAGVKDSGTLLPGHGGFLDRLDSSLFTLPVVYYWLRASSIAGS